MYGRKEYISTIVGGAKSSYESRSNRLIVVSTSGLGGGVYISFCGFSEDARYLVVLSVNLYI